jgi:molybdopterin-guanine dinucleotide biosynthesis protein A
MPIADLYVIAAGNGSRLNFALPKALVPIVDEPCLTTTLKQIGAKFRTVFVVTNVLAREQWYEYFRTLQADFPQLAKLVVNLPIRSGFGDGHATLQGLIAAEHASASELTEEIVVTWGDVFFPHAEIADELLSQCLRGPALFPAVLEPKPYVALQVNDEMQCVAAHFSKYGEFQASGLHDQSVFRFVRSRLRSSLCDLHSALWKGARYMTPGGELSTLYSLHHFYNRGEPAYVYETRYPTMSFNTVEEVAGIQREINVRWQLEQPVGYCASAAT